MMLFVYGTLLKGMERESVLARCEFHGPALLGADLFDLGAYPGIKEGNGNVVGELYRIDEETLAVLDAIEGFEPDQPEHSLYLRRSVQVQRLADGRHEQALTYFYNRPVREEDAIPHGDYRRHLLEQQGGPHRVVAYGSNMCRDRLEARVGPVPEGIPGHLDGYRLAFNKRAGHGGACYANAVWAGAPECCPAVVWELTEEQIAELDYYEGAPRHYLRVTLPFRDRGGESHIVQAYLAHPEWLCHDLAPTADYLNHIRRGYRQHGFDEIVLDDAEEVVHG